MADDERRAEIEAATDALLEDSGLRRYGAHRATIERRMTIALEAADRVRDARGDDERRAEIEAALANIMAAMDPKVPGHLGLLRNAEATLVGVLDRLRDARGDDEKWSRWSTDAGWARGDDRAGQSSPQGGDHEALDSAALKAAQEVAERTVMNVAAWRDLAAPIIAAYLSRVSPSRDARGDDETAERLRVFARNLPAEASETYRAAFFDAAELATRSPQGEDHEELIRNLLVAWLNDWEPGENQDLIDLAEKVLK